VVEAQHRVATLPLTETLEDQALLETLVEETKPAIPEDCRHLDYLLSTPFRYGPYPTGSRFRRAGRTSGVFYASEAPETAMAELAFHRLLFWLESPGLRWPAIIGEYSAFAVAIRDRTIDLTAPSFAVEDAAWTDRTDYGPCQYLADAAREADIGVIRYRSVRCPRGGINLAVLACRAFAAPAPIQRQTWRLRLSPAGVQALCEAPRLRLEFARAVFAADPRIADLDWNR
jgi:hypothetical protein